jgi:ubiquinone/menaquinone biosynthesis C-methylase UbiE
MIAVVAGPAVQHFDRLAARYSELRGSDAEVDPVTEAVVTLGQLEGCRVLDVGCGPGTVIRQLARGFGIDAVGVDPSPKTVEAARVEAAGCGVFHVGWAEELPLEQDSFDGVVMRWVVHHLERPAAFAEIRRVLTPGGRFIITSSDPRAVETFWLAPFFPSYAAIERRRFPDGATLRRELEEAGFTGIRVVPFVLERRFSRNEALEKLRARAYSSFVLMGDDEYEAGLAAAGAGLPAEIRYDLRLLNVLALRGARST